MNLKTNLLPHQTDAVNKVLPTRIGALFMEMGTGKSRTAIELVYRRLHKIDKVVWFCPVSLKETVKQEILKHTDSTDSDIHVFNNRTNQDNIPNCLWYVVGIESMSNSDRVVLTCNNLISESTFIILDESSYIKGYKSVRSQRVTRLSEIARYRLILTGTPLTQGVIDLYSQMRFLSPKILGYNSFYSFAANHLEYSDKYPGMIVRAHNTEYLAVKVKPYTYQVTKDECLDLPQKLYETRYFSMTDRQEEIYEMAKDEIISEIEDDEMESIAIFRMFSVLQGIVCGFWNRRIKKGCHHKIEFKHRRINALLNVINDLPSNEKIIIWTKYQYDIDNISKELAKNYGQNYISYFYGGLNEKQRNLQIEKFRNDSKFLIATQGCGSHGLTLNEAKYVIFYNNTFKYSQRLQAEDRCHRLGQENKVTYIDIECINSIDERISKALFKKGNVVDDFKKEVDKVKKEGIKELVRKL